MRVKISGITNLEDALIAADEGADAISYIFYEGSPRYISPEAASKINEQLPPFVEKVGIFAGGDAKYINKAIAVSGITLAQIHFQATDMLYGSLVAPHLRVVLAQRDADVEYLAERYRVVDTFSKSGRVPGDKLDLSWFDGRECSKIILAGGLTPDNVAETLPYGFYGVDVSNEVERAPGRKDRDKIRAFIRAAKQC